MANKNPTDGQMFEATLMTVFSMQHKHCASVFTKRNRGLIPSPSLPAFMFVSVCLGAFVRVSVFSPLDRSWYL